MITNRLTFTRCRTQWQLENVPDQHAVCLCEKESVTLSRRVLFTFAAVCMCASAMMMHANTAQASEDSEKLTAPEISIWVDDASLSMVVEQLASMAGKTAAIEGKLDGRVSGRFAGSMQDTLQQLTQSHPVLFDIDQDTLHIVDSQESSSVSIALNVAELPEEYKAQLEAELMPGNKLEFRDDAIRLSGHPSFVRRTAKFVTTTMVEAGAEPEIEAAVLALPIADVADDTESTVPDVADAGTDELLDDMQDEAKPETERAALSRPIRWVTDIPGFTTF